MRGPLFVAALAVLTLAGCLAMPWDGAEPPRADLTLQNADRRAPVESPDALVGFTGDKLIMALGEPDFLRRDGMAQIWQYRGAECVLDLFLYRDGERETVEHVELRDRASTAPGSEDCFNRLTAARHAGATS